MVKKTQTLIQIQLPNHTQFSVALQELLPFHFAILPREDITPFSQRAPSSCMAEGCAEHCAVSTVYSISITIHH
jgi:hypothetical protein